MANVRPTTLREKAYSSFTQRLLAQEIHAGQFITQRELDAASRIGALAKAALKDAKGGGVVDGGERIAEAVEGGAVRRGLPGKRGGQDQQQQGRDPRTHGLTLPSLPAGGRNRRPT